MTLRMFVQEWAGKKVRIRDGYLKGRAGIIRLDRAGHIVLVDDRGDEELISGCTCGDCLMDVVYSLQLLPSKPFQFF